MKRLAAEIEVQASVPRPKKNGEGMTKKRYPTMVSVGTWPVLYHDDEVILVKHFRTVSLCYSSGQMMMAGFHRDHPKASTVPDGAGWWRIAPASVRSLRALRRQRRT